MTNFSLANRFILLSSLLRASEVFLGSWLNALKSPVKTTNRPGSILILVGLELNCLSFDV